MTALIVYSIDDKTFEPYAMNRFHSYVKREDDELVKFMLEVAEYKHTFGSVLRHLKDLKALAYKDPKASGASVTRNELQKNSKKDVGGEVVREHTSL